MSARRPPNPAAVDVLLQKDGSSVRVVCNDRLGADLVLSCYRPYRVSEPSCGPTGSYSLDRHGTDWSVAGPAGAAPVTHETTWSAVADIEYRMTLELLKGAASQLHLHAAGLALGERAVLAIGGSGAGKSTLAAAWSVRGLPVLGDDTVLVDEATTAIPFKRLFKLSPAATSDLGVDPAETPFWEAGCDEVWFDPGVRGGWSGPLPLGLVVLLDRRNGGEPTATEEVSRREALNMLHASLMPTGLHGGPAFDRLLDAVHMVRTFRCAYRDAVHLCGVIEHLIP